MRLVEIKLNHELGQKSALERIKMFFSSVPKKYQTEISGFESAWTGSNGNFKFKIAKTEISGNLTVENNLVIITSKIPFAFILFKAKIEKIVTDNGLELLKK
ncbi:polyhydroxyalkanoic acid system family protein [Pedobacter sp. L105]|uniref:polyhydroxyalkanoic acid system family protein n=1 Tax=Pedobacter sp. L105 TaxID=1641871 RepID=UPI00131B6A97|nr:polyhydroxyalkanoic acid system family protein [Pedobacter sp. L105]